MLKQLLMIGAAGIIASPAHSQPVVTSDTSPAAEKPLPADSLAAGMRARVLTGGRLFRAGTIFAVLSDTVVLRSDRAGAVLRLPFSEMYALEVSSGRKLTRTRLVAAGAIGLVAGLGFAQVKQVYDDRNPRSCSGVCPDVERHNLRTGVLLGTAFGLAIAVARPGEHWRPVNIQ